MFDPTNCQQTLYSFCHDWFTGAGLQGNLARAHGPSAICCQKSARNTVCSQLKDEIPDSEVSQTVRVANKFQVPDTVVVSGGLHPGHECFMTAHVRVLVPFPADNVIRSHWITVLGGAIALKSTIAALKSAVTFAGRLVWMFQK